MGVSEPVLSVLFVCTGNTCRSPMAEAILRDRLGPDAGLVEIGSCGTDAYDGAPATSPAVETARRSGIDLRGHRARRLTQSLAQGADLILTMEPFHAERVRGLGISQDKVHLLGEWPRAVEPGASVPDPIGGSLEGYEECWRRIARHIDGFLPHLREELKARRA